MRAVLCRETNAFDDKVLNQNNGFRVNDDAGINHRKRLVNRQFNDFNIFTFSRKASALVNPHFAGKRGDEKVQTLSNGTRAHEYLANLSDLIQLISGLFFGFASYCLDRIPLIKQTGAGFNQFIVMSDQKRRQAELTGKDDRSVIAVVEQNSRTVAAILSFTRETLLCTIGTDLGHIVFGQGAPVICQYLLMVNGGSGGNGRIMRMLHTEIPLVSKS